MGEHLKKMTDNFEDEGRATLKEVGSDLIADFGRLGQATKDLATDSYDSVTGEVSGFYRQGKKKITAVGSQVQSRIRSHPVQTLLIAAGVATSVGFILGWFSRK